MVVEEQYQEGRDLDESSKDHANGMKSPPDKNSSMHSAAPEATKKMKHSEYGGPTGGQIEQR